MKRPTRHPDVSHLSGPMQQFYKGITRRYPLADQHRWVLLAALEAHDRMVQAREQLEAEGLTVKTRFDEVKAHPATAVERDSRTAFWRGLRELNLSDDAPDSPRPPRPAGRYQGRE